MRNPEATRLAHLIQEGRGWTHQAVRDHAVSAADTIERLTDALEKITKGQVYTEYRVEVSYDVNKRAFHGYKVEDIVRRAEEVTRGRVNVDKVEARIVIESPFEEIEQ